MKTEKKVGPAVEFVVKITQEDGSVVERTVNAPGEMLPAPEDFDRSTREGFLRDFDKLEKFLLESRDEVTKATLDAYMETVKKTNPAD